MGEGSSSNQMGSDTAPNQQHYVVPFCADHFSRTSDNWEPQLVQIMNNCKSSSESVSKSASGSGSVSVSKQTISKQDKFSGGSFGGAKILTSHRGERTPSFQDKNEEQTKLDMEMDASMAGKMSFSPRRESKLTHMPQI
jgi:hypothetical protein